MTGNDETALPNTQAHTFEVLPGECQHPTAPPVPISRAVRHL